MDVQNISGPDVVTGQMAPVTQSPRPVPEAARSEEPRTIVAVDPDRGNVIDTYA